MAPSKRRTGLGPASARDLDEAVGVYANDIKKEYYFSRDGPALFAQRQGGSKSELLADKTCRPRRSGRPEPGNPGRRFFVYP